MAKSQLPKSLTKVTAFSKALALLLILAFIGVAFYMGIMFDQKYLASLQSVIPTPTPIASLTPSPTAGNTTPSQFACQKDSDCVLADQNAQNNCCPNTRCTDYSSSSTVAENSQWVASQRSTTCGTKHLCPMIAVICPAGVLQTNQKYSAKCIRAVCTKTRS